jgi:(1->4)-alpha-D-glucan 1-alpha-D-glucosylmutase
MQNVQGQRAREIFETLLSETDPTRRIPVSTYRLQLNHQFRFTDAVSIVSYLRQIGITDVYASPCFKARKGSLHGYDIEDHREVNPEIGTEGEFDHWTAELKRHEMGLVLDVVPNHMSIAGNENTWWNDVLEHGPSSIYAGFFDINWKPIKVELEDKVLLPILGDQYGIVLENQELTLTFGDGVFRIRYGDRELPVGPVPYSRILTSRIEDLAKKLGDEDPDFQELLSILTAIPHLPGRNETAPEKVAERRTEGEVIKRRLRDLCIRNEAVRSFVQERVREVNGEKGNCRSFELLDELLNDQAYRLAYWRVATEEINYRRFFDINDLAAIRMEDPLVFQATHPLILKWIRQGKVTGLRADHPDGLRDPPQYFMRLQRGAFIQFCLRALAPRGDEPGLEEEIGRLYDEELLRHPDSPARRPLYVIGEKILSRGEPMPEDWPVFGTTGYDFLNLLNGIFVDQRNAKTFNDFYERFIRSKSDFEDLVYEKKKLVLLTSMSSEINTLGYRLNALSERDRHTRDYTLNSLTRAMLEVIACFPVYRTYVTAEGVSERDRRYIEQAVTKAKRRNPALSATIFDFVERALKLDYFEDFEEADRAEWLDFVMRFQQVTAPATAKGIEDTAFYVYNRFVSLNEVGGNPEHFGTPLDLFHGQNALRRRSWPHTLNATATHDTKRSEDARARLNVLSEMPDEWRQCVLRWSRANRKRKTAVEDQALPDPNEEYLLYQTLVGAWPLENINGTKAGRFKTRIREYMLKAAREAKTHTSWISPNTSYERALLDFVDSVLSDENFLREMEELHARISYFGMFNSLSHVLLKAASPGIPDFYQGTELWDFSLVDPDNRRPVDYDLRRKALEGLKKKMEQYGTDGPGLAGDLLRNWKDGSIKLFVILKTLNYRKQHRKLFEQGDYLPLSAAGERERNLCAFERRIEGQVALIAVPRFLTGLSEGPADLPLGEKAWGDSRLILAGEKAPDLCRNLFTGETIRISKGEGNGGLLLREVFAHFPAALLEGRNESGGTI